MLINIKPNYIDLFMHAVIGVWIGFKYGIPEGLFCFSVVATLDQILWVIKNGEVIK